MERLGGLGPLCYPLLLYFIAHKGIDLAPPLLLAATLKYDTKRTQNRRFYKNFWPSRGRRLQLSDNSHPETW